MSAPSGHDDPASRHEAPEVRPPSRVAEFLLLRTTFGLLLTMLIVAGGLMAYFMLVKEALPDLAIPAATVTTSWPGGDPQSIELQVTSKLEREIKTIRTLKKLTSASFDSFSIIAVEFQADADVNESMQLLRARISDAGAQLPEDAQEPRISQVSVDDRPILSFVLYGDVSTAVLSRVARDLQDRLESVAGVNEVVLGGAREEVVHLRLDPDRLLGLGIPPTQVRDAVRRANVDMPWGNIESEAVGASVRLSGRFRDVSDLRSLPVSRGSGYSSRIVRLGDLGRVYRDLEQENTKAFFSWEGSEFAPSVEVSVKKVPGADTVKIVQSVLKDLEAAQQTSVWAPRLKYRVTQNEAERIQDSLSDVLVNALQAMGAVFLILFVLLTWREGLIAGLAIPLTFLATLVVVWAVGFSLNELVIIGMILALGLLVDVFILMMEGLHEGIFVEKLSFSEAALSTVRRYAIPAAAGQLTTILALAPLMAIGGIAGKFIRVLPATAVAALAAAFIVALVIAVPLARYLLGRVGASGDQDRTTRVDRITARLSDRLRDWSLRTTLSSRRAALLWVGGAVVVTIVSFIAFTTVPVTMYTKGDGRKLGITVELPSTTRLATSQEVADRVGAILREKPYFESVVKLVGRKSPLAQSGIGDSLQPTTGENFVGFSAMFVERNARDRQGWEIAEELRVELQKVLEAEYAGANLTLVPETGEPTQGGAVQIDLTGPDVGTLRAISRDVQAALRQIGGTADVRDNVGMVRTEINMQPNREAIDFYGITQQELAAQVRYAMSGDEIAKFAAGGTKEDIPIKMGLDWPSRRGQIGGPTEIEELAMVRAFTPKGNTVPLLSLLEPRVGTAALSVTHKDGERTITVSSKAIGETSAQIIAAARPRLAEMSAKWPTGYRYAFSGETEEVAETFASAGAMLVVAIILVFGVLVLVFGSFRQSLILIATIPLGVSGTFIGFALLGMPFSFFAMVGVISLIGIVANDAIVMVDTMNRHLAKGIEVARAAARGAADRLRPIVSTSLTTIVGLTPLAISNPMWRPLCYAIIFGLIASTVLSLVIVPCLYMLFTRAPDGGDVEASRDPGPDVSEPAVP